MRYTFVKQHDSTDCAAACLAMVCLHYKKEESIARLREIMGTDLKGTNLSGLEKGANELGFMARAVRVDRKGFLSEFTLPCIANVLTKEGLSHFVVVFKKSEKYVVIGDPAKDLLRIPLDRFMKDFTGVLMILRPDVGFVREKKKSDKLFNRYIDLLRPHKKLFGLAIVASLIVTILGIVSSVFNKILMDEILPYKMENALLLSTIAFTGISLISVLVDFERQYILLYLSQKIDIPMMLGYFRHIFKLPMSFFSTRKTGDIITRFSDAGVIKNVFTNIALSLVLDVCMVLVSGAVLLNMNAQLFSIVLAMTAISVILMLIYKPIYKSLNEAQMQQASLLNSEIIEGLRGIEAIKGNAAENQEIENIEREYIRTLRLSLREAKISNTQGFISSIVGTIGRMVMVYVGINSVIAGELTLGAYMAFSTLAEYFTRPVSELVGMQLQIQEAQISMKRMSEIMEVEQEQKNSGIDNVQDMRGDIEFRNVTFRYGNRKPVLENVSFSIQRGQKVALVGASGSGKSTVAKLLLKYYEPENGNITLDGIDFAEYSNESVRRAIGYVPQNLELFSKSIYENICLTQPDATQEEVKLAAQMAKAHDFIRRMPGQYSTVLEEAGNGMSGGERQRIVMARAFLKDSDFYILDESTSNLDFVSESVIFDMIYKDFKDKSMLIIAHRLATVKNCDKILVLSEGRLIEQGTHEELMAMEGEYYRLWEMQQGNQLPQRAKSVTPPSSEAYFLEDEICY